MAARDNSDQIRLMMVLSQAAGRPLTNKDIQQAVELQPSSYHDAIRRGALITADRIMTAARNLGANPVELLIACGLIEPREAVEYVQQRQQEAAVFFPRSEPHKQIIETPAADPRTTQLRRITTMTDKEPGQHLPQIAQQFEHQPAQLPQQMAQQPTQIPQMLPQANDPGNPGT